ncbi:hypothetical protein [Brevibacterium moorei]|uniref:hypothetical protein n=1 Tax=Brevibacterium moorei TaxID=2968457 RepID=UPI00211C4C00|nr:hypothetical protein [Brevibacterium sp. 68QC2CO]MCQ9384416.1 hypothetical protein [Brevibacterium sp. 68QC2CO]
MNPGWTVETTVEVKPIHDTITHTGGTECPCGPTVEHQGEGTILTHHSLDGREQTE